VIDGETGRLVPPGDAPALALAIDAVLRDHAGASTMAVAGRARVRRHFSVERMVSSTAAVYRELLRAAPGRA
jgi:glycosyltransferase involved in cell wall biosynthesis